MADQEKKKKEKKTRRIRKKGDNKKKASKNSESDQPSTQPAPLGITQRAKNAVILRCFLNPQNCSPGAANAPARPHAPAVVSCQGRRFARPPPLVSTKRSEVC